MKALVFDSGALINFSMNGLLYVLEELKKKFDGKFLITRAVKYEVLDRPIKVQRFELEALRIKDLFDRGILEAPSTLGISEEIINQKTRDFMNKANHCIETRGKWINIVSEAEMSCLALSSELTNKGIENLIAIDERTTRVLAEKPENFEKIMSRKLHQNVEVNKDELKAFSKFKFIRSSELVYVAYKKKAFGFQDDKLLEASLYATKFHGAAISFEEIDVLKKL